MLIIPSIDLQGGICVRLKQGQWNQVRQFDVSPIERAAYFHQIGAHYLHVVDIDGAQSGQMQQLALICTMQQTGIAVQAGGGIRSLEQALLCYKAGVSRLVIGSIAVSKPQLTQTIIQKIKPEHIVLAIDIRMKEGIPVPAIHGWETESSTNLWDMVAHYQALGIKNILCTDIACDGMMNGPNFDLYKEALKRFPMCAWQASGGIRDEQDLAFLKDLGVAAAILGLTLYQGSFDLSGYLAGAVEW